jgi:hypothetical protein
MKKKKMEISQNTLDCTANLSSPEKAEVGCTGSQISTTRIVDESSHGLYLT